MDYLQTRSDVRARPDRTRRLVPRRLLRTPRGRVRETPRPVRRLGRQPQLGRGPAASAGTARARTRCRTTGTTCCGSGAPTTSTASSPWPQNVHLDGVVEQITVPFLIAHGENDRQIPRRVRPPLLRAGRQQPPTRAADLHPRRRRHRTHRPRPPLPRQPPSSPTGSVTCSTTSTPPAATRDRAADHPGKPEPDRSRRGDRRHRPAGVQLGTLGRRRRPRHDELPAMRQPAEMRRD